MLYRILTENKNKRDLLSLASGYFEGFTAIEGLGYWQGKGEQSLILEVETSDGAAVKRLANDIKIFNSQQAVLVEVVSNKSFLI